MRRYVFSLLCFLNLVVFTGGQTSAQQIHYYTILGCHDCEEIQEGLLNPLVLDFQKRGQNVSLAIHNVLEAQEFSFMQEELSRLGLVYQGTPFVILGDQYFYGNTLNRKRLEEELDRQRENQRGNISDLRPGGQTSAQNDPLPQNDFSLWAVLAAGLIDGINPCALMTLLFLISLLAVGGQTKKIIFLVGLGFTLGVFGTYLAIGVVCYRQQMHWAGPLGWGTALNTP
jgi:hypothetical protein